MTSRELRRQRREAERKARKLEYRQSRAAAASGTQVCEIGAQDGEPESSHCVGPVPVEQSATAVNACPAPQPPASQSVKSGSTGPRTATGKAVSSANSLKHGLTSGRLIIPGEDPAEFEALLSDLVKEHAPANETESLLVQQMAQSWWLMQRAIRIQSQAFTETRIDTHKLALFLRYQTTHERAFYRALNLLIKLQKERRKFDPEFVSQRGGATSGKREFVSQDSVTAAAAWPSHRELSAIATVTPPVSAARC
jgi:hypothetical protein